MTHIDKPSLSVCAFGAGAAHAAVLALILPVMITLPAPDDTAQGTVAIQVIVRSSPPPFVQAAMLPQSATVEGEGDIDEAGWAMPETEEITGALPEIPERAAVVEEAPLMEQAALSDPVEAALPLEAAAPVPAPEAALVEDAPASAIEEEVELSTVASIETDELDFMPDIVPRPLRKPKLVVVEERKVEPAPEPRQRVAAPVRARATAARPAPKPFKGFLGGTRATPMEEFPFRAGR